MEIKPLHYNLTYTTINGDPRKIAILQVMFGNSFNEVILTTEQLIKFLENPFTHFHIQKVDSNLMGIIFENLNVFTKMEIVNYLYARIEYIDYLQLQFSAAYVYDNDLEQIKFKYIKFAKEVMKLPSELKYISSCLGSYLQTADKTTRKMTPTQITLFRNASATLNKIRQLFSRHELNFMDYKVGVMSNIHMNEHIAGVVFDLAELSGVHLLAVLGENEYDNTANPAAPKIKELILRQENVNVHGKDEKRERIYVKYK
jgi:hypothetical protein